MSTNPNQNGDLNDTTNQPPNQPVKLTKEGSIVAAGLGNAVGYTASGATNLVGGTVGATGRGTGDVLTGVTGGVGKPLGEGIKTVGNTVQTGVEGLGEGAKKLGTMGRG